MHKRKRSSLLALSATTAALVLAASTALHAQTFSTERMIQLHAGPDEYYFFADDEKKVVDYKNDRMVRICVDESLHTVPMRVTHDGEKTIVHPGDCVRIEGKEFVLTPDTKLDEEWGLRAEVETLS